MCLNTLSSRDMPLYACILPHVSRRIMRFNDYTWKIIFCPVLFKWLYYSTFASYLCNFSMVSYTFTWVTFWSTFNITVCEQLFSNISWWSECICCICERTCSKCKQHCVQTAVSGVAAEIYSRINAELQTLISNTTGTVASTQQLQL